MKVLYLNHTGQVSGGERSLLTLLGGLPSLIEPTVACPPGELAEGVRALGVEVHLIPGIDGSLALHPTRTPRALAEIVRAGRRVASVAKRTKSDLIHANSIRAGMVSSVGTRSRPPRTLVHVRDCLPRSAAARASLGLVDRYADVIIANSNYTLAGLKGPRSPAVVVHNAVELSRFHPEQGRGESVRKELGIPGDAMVLTMIAQITPWKAQDDAIRVAAALARDVPGLRLLIVGSPKFASASTRYDNRAFLGEIESMVSQLGLASVVELLGERSDVPDILRASDLLLAPSWEEPFGRTIVEAMATGVPVAATNVGGPPEIVRHGIDGLLLPPHSPELWEREIGALLADRGKLEEMGRRGREAALASFGVETHVSRLTGIYREALNGSAA